MARATSKSTRKLVTLPLELAERVEKFRESTSAASESDALKALIEDGLKLHDRASDLFERFQNLSKNGQNIGEIINLLAVDHPLVASTMLNHDELIIFLKADQGQNDQRFVLNRVSRKWDWQHDTGYGGDESWVSTGAATPRRPRQPSNDLDDEIPF